MQVGPIIATNREQSCRHKQSLARSCRGLVEGRLAACVCVCVCVFFRVNIERRYCSSPSRRNVDMQLNNWDMFVLCGTHANMFDDLAKIRRAVGRWHNKKGCFV